MSKFNDHPVNVSCSSACMPYPNLPPLGPQSLMAPPPLYQNQPSQKETPVVYFNENEVESMKRLDYDPTKPLIDADQIKEDQAIINMLGLQADARLALFMSSCKKLRETGATEESITEFVNVLIDLQFSGRVTLDTTPTHLMTMKLVMRAALVKLVGLDQTGNGEKPA